MSAVDPSTEISSTMLLMDIIYMTLDCFHPEYDAIDRQAVASLARTCRAFSEPSLDRLWRKLYSLEPLIRCYTTLDDVMNAIPPSSLQFAVIDRYAPRIRELTVSGSASLYFLQCTTTRTSCLLPNLRILHWNPCSRPPQIPVILIQRLLNPQLVSLEANLEEADGPTLPSLFDSYLLQCQNLKSIILRFSAGALPAETIQMLSRLICRQKVLEKIIIRAPIDDIALKYLSTLPTVKVLDVILPGNSTFLPTEPVFCGVEQLGFETSDSGFAARFLQPHNQIFHTFRLRYNNRLISEAAVTFLNVLASRSPTKPLREVALTCGDFSHSLPVDRMESEAPRYRLSYKTLQPLVVLGLLRDLTIEWSEQISLDDDEIAELAHSWPLLQVFNFSRCRGGYPPFSTKYPTLRGLLSLVTCCPLLQTVSLPLDATQVPQVEEAGPFVGENLNGLTVPESPIAQALPVAEFLLQHFPSLTVLDARFLRSPGTDSAQIMSYEVEWQRVVDHLEWFRGVSPELDFVGSESSDEDEFQGALSDSDPGESGNINIDDDEHQGSQSDSDAVEPEGTDDD